ncbi:MAG TPA: hypothetical protein VKA21_14670 [Candidatus Binatia bacterium]|nr:hypothetical protein [Candidatus Binatia bacterium]
MAVTFTELVGTERTTKPLSDALAASVGRALPVVSASPGLGFAFDPVTGAYERRTTITGQLFLERAEPLGRGHWNVSVSYQRVKLDRFEGEDLEALHDDAVGIVAPRGNPVTFPRFQLDLDTHEITTSLTYGVTDDMDLNLTVPALWSEFRVRLTQLSAGGERVFADSATRLGVGDVFVRGKYRVVKESWLQTALGLVLRLPTGEEDDFQGTGTFDVTPMVYGSTRPWRPTPPIALQPYLNAGVDLNTDDVGASEARWGVGVDVAIVERTTLAAAFLARHPFRRIAPAGFFTFPRVAGPARPLFGIDGDRPDIYDLSFGGRVNVWRDTLMAFANVIVALNPDDGVRSEAIPTFGLEASF